MRLLNESAQYRVALVSGADLSAKQFYAVTLTSGLAELSGAAERSLGIVQNIPEEGETAEVIIFGISKAILGDTVLENAYLKTKSDGTLIPTTGAGQEIAAIALAGGVVGDIIEVFVSNGKTQA